MNRALHDSPKHTIRGKLCALALRGKRTAVSTALFFQEMRYD